MVTEIFVPQIVYVRVIKKYTEQNKAKQKKKNKNKKINILSYYLDQIEKYNCPGETELASGEALKSCEIILKAVFLAEWVECTINVWII